MISCNNHTVPRESSNSVFNWTAGHLLSSPNIIKSQPLCELNRTKVHYANLAVHCKTRKSNPISCPPHYHGVKMILRNIWSSNKRSVQEIGTGPTIGQLRYWCTDYFGTVTGAPNAYIVSMLKNIPWNCVYRCYQILDCHGQGFILNFNIIFLILYAITVIYLTSSKKYVRVRTPDEELVN